MTFNPGDISKSVNVPIVGDTLDEFNEKFDVDLSSTDADVVVPASPADAGTIVDDDPLVNLTIGNTTATRGHRPR